MSPDPKQIDGALIVEGTADLRKIVESVLIQGNLAHPEDIAEITDRRGDDIEPAPRIAHYNSRLVLLAWSPSPRPRALC